MMKTCWVKSQDAGRGGTRQKGNRTETYGSMRPMQWIPIPCFASRLVDYYTKSETKKKGWIIMRSIQVVG